MRAPMKRSILLLALGLLLAGSAGAQRSRSSDVPRLANGKPDLSGVWQAFTTANWNILTHGASAGPPEYGTLIATPPGYGIVEGDEIPYLPAAAEQQLLNYQSRFDEDPELAGEMLAWLVAEVSSGTLAALPEQPFPLDRAAEAFRFMAQARHIGKIVLTQPEAERETDGAPRPAVIRPDASYLVTGGLGALGLATSGLRGVAAALCLPWAVLSRRLERTGSNEQGEEGRSEGAGHSPANT